MCTLSTSCAVRLRSLVNFLSSRVSCFCSRFTLLHCFLFSLLLSNHPIPPLSSYNLTPLQPIHTIFCFDCAPATFIFHFSSFHPAFSFPLTLLSTPLLYSLRCLSPSVLPPCLVSFQFLPPWLAFPPSNPPPISPNLVLCCHHLPLHSLPQFIFAHFSLGLKLTFPLYFLYTLFSPFFCCLVQRYFSLCFWPATV